MSQAQNKTSPDHSTTWYILRGEMRYGPYDYKAMLTMIQSGELFDYNYVWAPHLEQWSIMGDLPEFSKDRLCRLIENKTSLSKVFIQRASPRIEVQTPVYAHNNLRFFDGMGLSLSQNGALLLINDPTLLPTQRIALHFRQSEWIDQAFNVEVEIIRKNYSKQRLNVKSGLHYAVRFLQISEEGLRQIQSLTTEKHGE
ncbi:MAG: PilZ domain-containing protein [Pseudobdellovibrionaceae bacterium]